MNFEALGRYEHAKKQKLDAQRKLSLLARALRDAAFSMENYQPPYAGKDLLPEQIATVQAVLPEMQDLQQRIVALSEEMAALREEYNLI